MTKFLLLLLFPVVYPKSAPGSGLGISGWYTGYLKLYDSSKQYYERYNVQLKIYQRENIILASALDLAVAGHCYAISELRGFVLDGKLHLQAQRFRKKQANEFVDFILSDYAFPVVDLNNKFWYGTVFSFHENRQLPICTPQDGIFLERKTNTMSLETLYEYKLPTVTNSPRKNNLHQQYEQKLRTIDNIFSLKHRKRNFGLSARPIKRSQLAAHKLNAKIQNSKSKDAKPKAPPKLPPKTKAKTK